MESNSSNIILKDIAEFIQSWKTLNSNQIYLKRMSGLTNQIYKVSHENQKITPKSVIYRKLGDDSQNLLLDRQNQNRLVKELQFVCGPKVYGLNESLRIEQYLEGNILQTKNMQDEQILKAITAKIWSLQRVQIDFLQKTSIFQIICSQSKKYHTFLLNKINKVELFQPWQLQVLSKLIQWYQVQIIFIKQKLQNLNKKLVLSHNDLLPGNVMILSDKIQFIDFQYTTYNYDSYDIANYLNQSLIYYIEEYPYFQCKNLVPDVQVIESTIQYYLLHKVLNAKDFFEIDNRQTRDKLIQQNDLQAQFQRMHKEIRFTLMLSNFYWGVWTIFMTKNSPAPFDYIKFGDLRMQQYYANKHLLKF